MIEREITPHLTGLFQKYPIVTVTGPRQSGKTTLCRSTFSDLAYANLEAPDQRYFAESDPRGFLAQFSGAVVIDEIQHVPELLSYLQVIVDDRGHNGQYVLTGSEQFPLSDAISQFPGGEDRPAPASALLSSGAAGGEGYRLDCGPALFGFLPPDSPSRA